MCSLSKRTKRSHSLIWIEGEGLAIRRSFGPSSALARFGLRILQLHLCVVYLATGIDKTMGSDWWDGEAIWRSIQFYGLPYLQTLTLASHVWLAKLMSWGTLLIESGYPVFIWPRKTRAFFVTAILGLHIGIAATLGLWSFSAMMIVLTFSAFAMDGIQSGDCLRISKLAARIQRWGRTRVPPSCTLEMPRDDGPSPRIEHYTCSIVNRL